jgi:hypothetical protein
MKWAVVLLAAGLAVWGQESPEKRRAITAAARARFWRAVYERAQAQLAFERADRAAQEAQAEMRKECGGAGIVVDAAGEPQCKE